MSRVLAIRNRQRVRRVDTSLLRQILARLLGHHLHADRFQLCFHLVGRRTMTHMNESFLRHAGSTDVITFDHSHLLFLDAPSSSRGPARPAALHGEIFVCLDEALGQAHRFRTTWQSELIRYCLHGLLHLCGQNDRRPAARRTMKRMETRMLRALAREFPIARLRPARSRRALPRRRALHE